MSRAILRLVGLASLAASCAAMAQAGQDIASLKANAASAAGKAKIAALKTKAANGSAEAQDSLGYLYQIGIGLPQDYFKAIYWYRKAASRNLADAQARLGFLYGNGEGVPKDYQQAVRWYRKAAEQGSVYAQFNLGTLYAEGRGVPQDYAEAYFWFDLAAAGKVDARDADAVAKNRDQAASYLTPSDLSRVQERARKWFEDHPAPTPAQ